LTELTKIVFQESVFRIKNPVRPINKTSETITIIDILIIFFKKTSTPGKFIHAFLILQHRQNRTQDYLISHIAGCSIKRIGFTGN